MKKIRHLFIRLLFLSLMTLVVACGSPATSGSPTTAQSPSAHDATSSGHGSTGQGQSGKSEQEVTIKLTEFAIETSLKSFTPGSTYRFVVTNAGKAAHEFMITPKSFGPIPETDMGNMHGMVLAHLENIEPGQTKTLDYTFPNATKGSRPEFVCYLPGHYETGMKLEVSVQ